MSVRELSTARGIVTLLRRIHIHPAYFLGPILLSMGAATFEGIGMGLLIPLLNGFLTKDYSFMTETPILGSVLAYLPEALTSRDRSLLAILVAIFVLVIALKNILRGTASASMAYLGTRTTHHLRKQVFNTYLSFGKRYFDRTSIGQHSAILSQFTTEALQPLLNIDRSIHALFSLCAYLVIMLMISWKLTLVAIPLFAILYAASRKIIATIRHLSHKSVESASILGKKTTEILSIIPLVHASNTEERERRHYTDISDERARLEFRTTVLRQLIGPIQELISLFAVLLLLAGMLYILVREGSTTPPAFLVYFYLLVNTTNKFGVISGFLSNLANSSGPVHEVLSTFATNDKGMVPTGEKQFKGLSERIAFMNLSFAYDRKRPILRDLTFTIKRGRMTALAGPTGTGKSTIISLLLRFYDCPPGTILIDGTDIRAFSTTSLRARMALVSQETLLLHDTLRENIVYGTGGVAEERLQDVIRKARLDQYIGQLPDGLETLIGDRGVKLSGGENQRVSIARALLKQADILILDEATSSLDSQTERLVQEAIEEAIEGKTAIVIAHRLSTIRDADCIVVIDDGTCIETGTLDELLTKNGAFAKAWEAQQID